MIVMSHLCIGVKMLYWVIYDISDDKIRNRVVSKCKNYGLDRVQKSAFIGNLTKNKAEMLAIDIKDFVKGHNDCVFVIPSCKECFGSKDITGSFDEEKVKQKEFLILSNCNDI